MVLQVVSYLLPVALCPILAKYEEQIILDFTVAAAVGNPAET
jgi:hypothetical protein